MTTAKVSFLCSNHVLLLLRSHHGLHPPNVFAGVCKIPRR